MKRKALNASNQCVKSSRRDVSLRRPRSARDACGLLDRQRERSNARCGNDRRSSRHAEALPPVAHAKNSMSADCRATRWAQTSDAHHDPSPTLAIRIQRDAMTTRTAEEAKANYIDKMGEPLGTQFAELFQEVGSLYVVWGEFIEPLGLTSRQVVRAIGVIPDTVLRLSREEIHMSAKMAQRFGRYFRSFGVYDRLGLCDFIEDKPSMALSVRVRRPCQARLGRDYPSSAHGLWPSRSGRA
jgi:hypothetical protein